MGVKSRGAKRLCGYSSWYNRYQNIDAESITGDLAGCAEHMLRGDLFQIDDGWEPAVGDWLETDAKNDGLVIKVLSLLSTLVEMEELDAALSERALGVVARRLRSSNVKYDLLLSVAVFLEAACNASQSRRVN